MEADVLSSCHTTATELVALSYEILLVKRHWVVARKQVSVPLHSKVISND
jgi:hypothetical protein